MIARLLFIGGALLVVLLALDYKPGRAPGEFYALLLFSTAGMCVMAAANELITAFLALELASLALYVLAGYFRSDPLSAEAGMKYFVFGALSSGLLLYGMSLVYGFTAATLGTVPNAQGVVGRFTQFDRIATAVASATNAQSGLSALLTLGLVFILAGVGYKIAVFPFHAWSPDVYQGAPTPVTAFIATASKVAGFLLLFRLLSVAFPQLAQPIAAANTGDVRAWLGQQFGGWTGAVALLALGTIVFGNLAALPQQNAKRLLAYSSIAHTGFVLLALLPFARDERLAAASLLYYLIVYVVTNIGAFGALTLIERAGGGTDINDLAGLARRNLPLAALLTVFVLSLAGIPPLGGFFAKLYVFMAAWQGEALWLLIVAVVATVVALYYYLRLVKAMFVDPPADDAPLVLPRAATGALVAAFVLVLALGLFPGVVLSVFDLVSAPVAAGS
jgi:NADH-quinone oxidoreductase subunit N